MFAPLARMLGLYSFKQELEELSFRYLQPEVYKNMVKRLAILKKEQQPVVSQVCAWSALPALGAWVVPNCSRLA